CTMRGCRRTAAAPAPWPRSPCLRKWTPRWSREDWSALEAAGETAQASEAHGGHGQGSRDRGLEVDLPARLDLPEGLQGHPARPGAGHDEQRPVPPAPGQDQTARPQAHLHVLPGWTVVLPVRA